MLEFHQWEIYEADVPFSEDLKKSKRRPVVIVKPGVVLVLKLTSHGHSDKPKPLEYEISKWEEAGLSTATYVECNHFIRLSENRFTGKQYGRLMACDIKGLQAMMAFHGLGKPIHEVIDF